MVKSNVMTMPRDQKVTCAVECRDGGAGNVCFNAAIGREAGKSRANAVMGIKKGNDRVVGLLFFSRQRPGRRRLRPRLTPELQTSFPKIIP